MWSDLEKGRWAINFDLDTKKAEEFHPSHTRQGAYEELKNFFLKNRFVEHCQYSGYRTTDEFTAEEIRFTVLKMVKTYPYSKNYIRHMDATIIKPEYIYDCKELFDEDSEVVEYTGELENFIPQPKVQENREFDQMQNEEVIPQEIKNGVLEKKIEIPIKPLEKTTTEDKTEVVKKTPKIKM